MKSEKFRKVSAAEILRNMEDVSPVVRVKVAQDMLPGGLAMAMLPVFVTWNNSSPGFGPDDYYMLRNVNVAGNPVAGNLMLAGVKVMADSVESVEFVMVTEKVGRVETNAGHGMLRFIFREDRRPVVLNRDGTPMANDATMDDLIISWEAWRPPTASFDPLKGLDPQTYALTPRCLVGSVRCLTDSILDRPWHCYPLKFADVEHAGNELLYVSLALADAVARQTATTILDQRIEQGQNLPEDYADPELNEWAQLSEQYKKSEIPENPIQDLLDGRFAYHLLERSCITMALSSIDWANRRSHDRGGLGEPEQVRVAPTKMPSFMAKLANGSRTTALLRAPAALHWIMTNQKVIPGKAYELLDEVGLIQRENGRVKKTVYDNRQSTAYGEVADHLIY